ALARSWAAQHLIESGQAPAALAWVTRTLDLCGEDQLERARAVYMRGRARLAVGDFAAAIDDANVTLELARTADNRLGMVEAHELRWGAAVLAGDSRAAAWDQEMRVVGAKVYQQHDYDALPDLDVLPGEPGFHARYSRFDWPDSVLAAVPP